MFKDQGTTLLKHLCKTIMSCNNLQPY